MSSGRSNKSSNNGGGVGVSSIPAASRTMVRSLKEIVNCSEDEIYAMLKECNMDPNDTVHKLLSQDPFHEVKSKREKKKEIKETSEPRSRGVSTTSSRGGRGGATRYDGRSGYTQFNSSESGVLRGKPAFKKENGTADISNSTTSTYAMPETNISRQPASFRGSVVAENKSQTTGAVNGTSSSSQLSPGFQPAWVGVPGQVSMADIVKMGRRKASGSAHISTDASRPVHNAPAPAASNHNVNHHVAPAHLPRESHYNLGISQDSASKVSEPVHEAGVHGSQHAPPSDGWDLLEQSSAREAPVLDPPASAEVYTDPSISSNLHSDRTTQQQDSWSDELQGTEGVTDEHLNESYTASASEPGRQIQEDNSGGASHFDDDSFNDMNSYPTQRHTFEHHEGSGTSSQLAVPNYSVSSVEDVNVAVSSAAANMQQLNLQDERAVRSADANPAVIIPNHLQIPTADCSHLSFGSFGSNFPGSYQSNTLKSNLEESSVVENAPSSDHSETRGPEYFGDDHLQSTADGNVASRTSADAGSYDAPAQPEVMKHDADEAVHGHQYNFSNSVHGYTLDNNSQLNSAFPYENSQMHNLAPLSSVMQAYSNSLQGNPLAPTGHPARESSDLTYSSFLSTQSVPTKYSTAASSINGPSLSMPENVKSGMFSMPHPTAQALPGTNIATGPALPQHLVHPYSQPTLPLGHFANMIGYPFLPQSYAYMPPAYQQAYAGNSTYHQTPAAVHNSGVKYTVPQYKSSLAVSSLPQSASVPSAYGGFGSSINIPGGFPLNPSTTSASSTIGYDDIMNSQYKESSHFLPLQQGDNSTVWVQGPGSRTVSALPASTYYSFQGQGQQHSAFRQGQQPSQHYGNLGYQNFYHSQAGVSQEHQQQTPNEGQLSGSQGAPSKQSHQIWQHSY